VVKKKGRKKGMKKMMKAIVVMINKQMSQKF